MPASMQDGIHIIGFSFVLCFVVGQSRPSALTTAFAHPAASGRPQLRLVA